MGQISIFLIFYQASGKQSIRETIIALFCTFVFTKTIFPMLNEKLVLFLKIIILCHSMLSQWKLYKQG